jgi:hypothetical protein
MTAPIQDVSSLPGRKVSDQEEAPIGEVKEIYAVGGDGHPVWVTVEASAGIGDKRLVFIPLARLKEEDGELRVPYSKNYVRDAPEVDGSDGISPECERRLRDHYGIDRADQELRSSNDSYATLVPEDEGKAERAADVEALETPDADKKDDQTLERLQDVGRPEAREVNAHDVVAHNDGDDGDDGDGDDGNEATRSSVFGREGSCRAG